MVKKLTCLIVINQDYLETGQALSPKYVIFSVIITEEIQGEKSKEPMEELTEEQFLKDLYLFMKKRDTPIERIPNLGFKQNELKYPPLFQVTSQQLWKQVYNTLGGNPRSTSAATCTRRHYEKLLLPYECHVKGISINVLPQHQPRNFPYANYDKVDDGQRPAKRRLLSIPLEQVGNLLYLNKKNNMKSNQPACLQKHKLHFPKCQTIPLTSNGLSFQQCPYTLQSDPHAGVFPLSHHYPPYYHPNHAVLPPYVPIAPPMQTSHSPSVPRAQFTVHPSCINPVDRVKEPLEHLRNLAEWYKTSSGLTEPLNLSVKAASQESNRSPASSFGPPASSPKFLNKPSPLYTLHHRQVVRDEGCETQDGESDEGISPYPHPVKTKESCIIDVNAASRSPTYNSAPTLKTDHGTSLMTQKPGSPKTDFTVQPMEEREGSPEVMRLSLGDTVPSFPQDHGDKMEIEIPLSVFRSWLKLYGSSGMMHGAKQLTTLPTQEERSRQRDWSDTADLPTNMSFLMNPQDQSPAAEDLTLKCKNVPSPTPTRSPNHFTAYKSLPSGGILQNVPSQDIRPVDRQNNSRSPPYWDAYDKEIRAPHMQVKMNSYPLAFQQDLTSIKPYKEDTAQERSDTGPSAVLMVGSSSASLLQLTTEEVMKLKKIISSSL
uniref:AT-rich interaction domain 6 n=1 Tax=Mastacembelus armatus TaxID=205130 RepID=A0A3Q3L1B8_9TELE